MKQILLLLVFAVIVGCGAASPPTDESNSLFFASRATEAIWHSENGNQSFPVSTPELMNTEEGPRTKCISLGIPGDHSSYVHGVFSIDVPDESNVKLVSYVGFPNESVGSSLRFRIYIQVGSDFPLLAEVTSYPEGRLDRLEADLTPFRGQHRLLIFAVEAVDATTIKTPAVWVQPSLFTPVTL